MNRKTFEIKIRNLIHVMPCCPYEDNEKKRHWRYAVTINVDGLSWTIFPLSETRKIAKDRAEMLANCIINEFRHTWDDT